MPESTIAFSTSGAICRKRFDLLLGAEAHHPLDAGAVVPAAVEDHDLAGGRQVRQVALDVHLRLLALGRRGQRDDAEHARADALGDRLDRAALAGAVAPLEDDADLQALVHDPLLQLDELDMQPGQLALVVLAFQLAVRRDPRLSLASDFFAFFAALMTQLSQHALPQDLYFQGALRPGEEQADIARHSARIVDNAGGETEPTRLQILLQ